MAHHNARLGPAGRRELVRLIVDVGADHPSPALTTSPGRTTDMAA
jgi:hypothetical protein